jgi:tetratricopeptide (TPR) repeat protein
LQEALAYYEESLALSRELGESDFARGITWNDVADVYISRDEPSRALPIAEHSYQLFRREHSAFFAASCAFTLGRAEWRLGAAEAARAHLDEAERLFRTLGNPVMAARTLYFRAGLALEAGQIEAARRDLAQALTDLSSQLRESEYLWWLVERAATLACRSDAPQHAARLYGAALSHRDATPRPLDPAERELRAHDLEGLRATLGEVGFTSTANEGCAMSITAAIALTCEVLQVSAEPHWMASGRAPARERIQYR